MRRAAFSSIVFASVLSAGACDKTDTPPAPPPGGAAAAPTSKPDFASADCADWSKLDPASLPPIPNGEHTTTLESAWSILLAKHYDPTLGCKDWPAVRAWYGEQVASAPDRAQAYALMNDMLGELEQSHLVLVPPGARTQGEPRSGTVGGDGLVPISVRLLGDAAVIVDPKLYGLDSGMPAGASVVSIDDRQIGDALKRSEEHAENEIERAFVTRRQIGAWLTCPIGATKTIGFVPAGDDAPQTKTVPCQDPKLEKTTFGNLTQPTVIDHRMVKGTKVGYISFNIWLLPLMPKIEAAIAKLRKQGMKSLVLDLRGNPGGVGMMVVPLARQLLAEDVNLGIMRMREGQQEFNVSAGKDPFAGSVAVLVDEGSASTSEIFAQSMQDIGRIQVFGASRTPGAALPSLIEELPGGAILQYVIADYQSPKGTSVEGRGVQPDTLVPESAADFAAGHDPVLDAAVGALTNATQG